MTQLIETLAESNFRRGKSFLWLYSESALANGATDNIVVHVGNTPVIVTSLILKSNGELNSWQAFGGTTYNLGTGTVVDKIVRNQAVANDLDTKIIINPTGLVAGTPFFTPKIELVAQEAVGGRAFLEKRLVNSQFALAKNTAYLIAITNDNVTSDRYEIEINICSDE